MWSSGQLEVHCQPLCGGIIGVRIRSSSWYGVPTLHRYPLHGTGHYLMVSNCVSHKLKLRSKWYIEKWGLDVYIWLANPIKVVATFLIIFGVHTNILFLIKVKFLVPINQSYRSPSLCLPMRIPLEDRSPIKKSEHVNPTNSLHHNIHPG